MKIIKLEEEFMRVTKEEKVFPDVDFTKPVFAKDMAIKENDCLGKEWDPYDKACTYCAECELCGVLYQQPHNKRVKEAEDKAKEKGTPFLDTAYNIHTLGITDKFHGIVLRKDSEGDPVSKYDVVDMFREKYNISDEVVVVEWIKKFLKDKPDIKLQDGFFKLREDDKR